MIIASTKPVAYSIGSRAVQLVAIKGKIAAGDAVAFAGDAHQYAAAADVAEDGVLHLAEPGLLRALPDASHALSRAA